MIELKTNEDLKIIWIIFYDYSTKSPIEVDATIARSTKDIIRMLQRSEPSVCNGI